MNTVHHSLLAAAIAGTACFFTACQNPAGVGDGEDPPLTPNQPYLGTASIGDFMLLTADRSARVITYQNFTTGQNTSLPYQIATDESYTMLNPQGHLVDAWESAGVTLLGTSTRNHPPTGAPSLITAIPSTSLTLDTLTRGSYNVIQFRTRLGGFEAGYARVDPGANIIHQTFSPYRQHNLNVAPKPFQDPSTWNSSNMRSATGGHALTMLFNPGDNQSGPCHVFQAPGLLLLDTPEGSMICAPQTLTATFDPTKLGSYNGVIYHKQGATMSAPTLSSGVESGTTSVGRCVVAITGAGHIRVQVDGVTQIDNDFQDIATDDTLTGSVSSGLIESPCNGMFSDHNEVDGITHYLFVTFSGKLVVFGYYSYVTADTAAQGYSKPYEYYYGTALKWSDTVAPALAN